MKHINLKTFVGFVIVLAQLVVCNIQAQNAKMSVAYVKNMENQNHPQMAYWFFNKDMLVNKKYRLVIDTLARESKFDMLFLTCQGNNQVNLFDVKTMYPILKDMVQYAQEKGIRIGLQLFPNKSSEKVSLENTTRMIQEGEMVLSENGTANYTVQADYIRNPSLLIKSDILKVYAFKKISEWVFDATTLLDITQKAKAVDEKGTLQVSIDAGKELKDYTVYILSQHYYNYSSCESNEDSIKLRKVLTAYSDIPLGGVSLDEYCNLDIKPEWTLKKGEVYRGRRYSLPMSKQFKQSTGNELEKTLFDMRYAPIGKPEVRIKAINEYMLAMSGTTERTQLAMYEMSKSLFGKNTFIGFHNTRHNALNNDEVWETGLNWWRVKRDYGHSDEYMTTPVQLGIGMSYHQNAMYNMFYTHNLKKLVTKTLSDLRYGIRTNYLSVASSMFGARIDSLGSLASINKVENFTRLMNRFNPSFPKIKLLVLFGMPEQLNWFPDESKRNKFDISNIEIEKKAQKLWEMGYLNALFPTNVIDDKLLVINKDGKPTINGHTFDAVVFLYPEYSKKSTLNFLKQYVDKGGKLMVEGRATYDFEGQSITDEWDYIRNKAVEQSFSIDKIQDLGISTNPIRNGVENEDGSFTFTNNNVFNADSLMEFEVKAGINAFKGKCKEGAVIKIGKSGGVEKLAATGFISLSKNGKPYLSLDKPADVFYEAQNGKPKLTIIDETKTSKVVYPLQ